MEDYIDFYDSTNIFNKHFEYTCDDFYDVFNLPPTPPPELSKENILLIIYLAISIYNKKHEDRIKQLRSRCKKKQRR